MESVGVGRPGKYFAARRGDRTPSGIEPEASPDLADQRLTESSSVTRIPRITLHGRPCVSPLLESLDRTRADESDPGTEVLSSCEGLLPACALHWTRPHDLVYFIFRSLNADGLEAHGNACGHARKLRSLSHRLHRSFSCFTFFHGYFHSNGPFKSDEPIPVTRYRADTARLVVRDSTPPS